jgi:5'(3')-deoxyribonucleotidase
MRKKTIAIDFDGVIHQYSKGWQNGEIYDPPMEGALDAVKKLASNNRLVIFSTRARDVEGWNDMIAWLTEHGFMDYFDKVTSEKPIAHIYIDDRGLRFHDWAGAMDTLTEMDFVSDQELLPF